MCVIVWSFHMDSLRSVIPIVLLFVAHCVVMQQDPCNLKQTCSACIQEPGCFWCSGPLLNGTEQRCSQEKVNCNENYIVDPVTNYTELKKENTVSDVNQITPQEVHLSLRINKPFNITLKYSQAEYPVDLYYLMDLSYSMKDDKDMLQILGRNLEELMTKFTSDFQLGFGSFVDKIVRPYTNTLPSKMKEPCVGCRAPYGFHNHMKLSDNVTHFFLEVGDASVSGNIDDPEGGFDALMQTVVCSEKIGWRRNTRRLLVFSSDNGFHIAGDGKLGGIIEPNDGKCHLNEDGMYTHSALQDYPSVSHLSHKVRENAINIIFAVTEPQLEAYRLLTKNIDGAKVGHLTADSSNILELVEEQYKKISSSVDMRHDAPEHIQVMYYTSCQSSSDEIRQSNKCDKLQIGEEVEFRVEIKVLHCPNNRNDWKQTFKIFPVGSQEATLVHLEMNCDCPCEHKEDHLYKENAEECSSNGTYMCGVCDCNNMHFGKKCQCSSIQPLSAGIGIPSDCLPSTDNLPICSEHGTCTCGVCQCEETFYGKYCECDDSSCRLADGELCGGRGTCKCGKCQCEAGWTGEACECSLSTENCKADDGSAPCSNHGHCKCGTCNCSAEYRGKYCENSIPAVAQTTMCEHLFPCVLCQVHETDSLNPEQCANCTELIIEEVDDLFEEEGTNCVQFYGECRSEYQYLYNETSGIIIRTLRSLKCPLQLSFTPIIVAIIAFILALGIIALCIWKYITVRKDQLEFIKFKNEQAKAEWDVAASPLYIPPVTTFKNPTYNAVS